MEKLTDAIGIVLFESEKFGGSKISGGWQTPSGQIKCAQE